MSINCKYKYYISVMDIRLKAKLQKLIPKRYEGIFGVITWPMVQKIEKFKNYQGCQAFNIM